MRVVQINAVPYGSTGRIMFQLADALQAEGNQTLCTAGFTWKGSSREDFFVTSNILEKTMHTYLARFTGRIGCFSAGATRRLLQRLDAFRPDIIHLHNLHGWFLNLPMLFSYCRERKIRVVWTLHDCWPFTGHCPHFVGIGCEKWRTGCGGCPLYRQYPRSYVDASGIMYRKKKAWFTGVEDLTLVAPSRWLGDLAEQSFLGMYPVEVIPNGIDLSQFQPRENDVKSRCGIRDKKLILGVSYAWDNKKGLDVFLELSRRLVDGYRIMLVGTDDQVDKLLPPEILSVHRTDSPQTLAELYSAADVFVNPTREDTLPTVNMEALACGTPVVTFQVGGSAEVADETCGVAVPKGDVDALEAQIRRVCEVQPFTARACVARAGEFSQEKAIGRYLALYRRES